MTTLYNHLPTLDLHGMDREYAKLLINEFIQDQYAMKNQKVIIIHGNGTGILKKTTQETKLEYCCLATTAAATTTTTITALITPIFFFFFNHFISFPLQ